jgi:hypothetical protein
VGNALTDVCATGRVAVLEVASEDSSSEIELELVIAERRNLSSNKITRSTKYTPGRERDL